ncbi:MAG TPA: FMN-dependent NADH-azoreductase, partial [Actinomycetota bacterium]|nr:FMN-dependent NADH-azoreductase [Actinomycetota bacterium]
VDLQMLFKDVLGALVVLPDNVADPNYSANRTEMSRAISQALRARRVGHVVVASSVGADHDRGVGQVGGLHELEQLLFGLEGTDVLSLRAAWHMENLLAAVPMVKEQRVNGSAIKGDLRIPMIATVDIADRAAARLLRRDLLGDAVETVLGPEDVSLEEATRALGAALGIPELPYVQFPPEGVKAALQGIGMSEEFASLLVESQIATNDGRMLEGVERTPEATTPTRLEDFLAQALER